MNKQATQENKCWNGNTAKNKQSRLSDIFNFVWKQTLFSFLGVAYKMIIVFR